MRRRRRPASTAPNPGLAAALAFALVAASALGAAGCIDFVEPEGRPGLQTAQLSVTLHLVDDTARACPEGCVPGTFDRLATSPGGGTGALAWLEGSLDPGTDLGGETRSVPDPTVGMLAVRVPPADTTALGVRRYRAAWLPSLPADARIVLDPPAVANVDVPRPTVDWGVPTRADPDTVSFAPGENIRLHVGAADSLDLPAPSFRSWSLQLSGAGGHYVQVSSDGVPPDTLVVPSAFLPEPDEGSMVAELTLIRALVMPGGDRGYAVTFITQIELTWTVRITALPKT